MTDKPTNRIDNEDELDFIFGSVLSDNADVDQEFLDQLKSKSSDLFASSLSSDSNFARPSYHPNQTLAQSHPMRTSALVATIAIVFSLCWFVAAPQTEASALKLGDVLSELEKVENLQLRVTRDQQSADVWIKNNSAIRWESSPRSYQVARGSKLWEVFEADSDNPQVSSVSVNPWIGEEGNLDLVALMGIEANSNQQLLEATPDGMATYSGVDCLVFRELVQTSHQPVRLSFYVKEVNKELIAVTARAKGTKRRGPPLAEIAFVAQDVPVNDAKFRVPVDLSEQNRIGKIIDSQGIVSLRPLGASRWTPLVGPTVLQPKDRVRTDKRGANAITIELASGVKLIAGPGSLVEIGSADAVRLQAGTVQIHYPKSVKTPFTLTGENDQKVTLEKSAKVIYRVDEKADLVRVKKKPIWLSSYEGSSAENSIGSLIVEIDGRATPLTIGEHHVTVEIRDQIARTTIEETFVNHTDRRMEGQFHFPLPQDASISGFGMWIAGELIEADVVEKQRAREIYETILRERRDPGLLEWAGGNIFKARVFPIEAHSEKRVKIVYTQVLPLQGDRFRYSYALKSEMLQTNPLRELNIRCFVNSTVPLSGIDCPSHTCRTQLTDHSAELEFVAQEYSPTKDFEVVCDVSQRENDVVMIPHRRGNNGYFLLELMPPGADSDWQRQTVGESDPLELILLCDTSGSMDSSMRDKQLEFVLTTLRSLGEKDRFKVAMTDVKTDWILNKFSEPTTDNIETVRTALEKRISLGWTDLDQAFDSVLEKATPNSQVIYIGDGIFATSESDPVPFVNRLKLRFEKQFAGKKATPAFHAVSVGSSFESLVLKGIASLGGGSQRQIAGEITSQMAALGLLKEMTRPGLKDVNVRFEGLKVAAVYPEQLPNIPTGTQQVLVGRYLPTGKQQSGKVIVTGTLDGKPVKYVAKVELADAEKGNSFIPRLWARGHLDQLLQQGSGPKIQEQVIALSEEFHIITPYTSLLVLESDADRERFGVKRRFGMRNGEQFFADGRSNANYELKQRQMQKAGNWRIGLRSRFGNEFMTMGRDANVFQGLQSFSGTKGALRRSQIQPGEYPQVIVINGTSNRRFDNFFLGDQVHAYPSSWSVPRHSSFATGLGRSSETATRGENHLYFTGGIGGRANISGESDGFYNSLREVSDFDVSGAMNARELVSDLDSIQLYDESSPFDSFDSDYDGISLSNREVDFELSSLAEKQKKLPALLQSRDSDLTSMLKAEEQVQLFAGSGVQFFDSNLRGGSTRGLELSKSLSSSVFSGFLPQEGLDRISGRYGRSSQQTNSLAWTQQLFPQIAQPILETDQPPKEPTWSAEAVELSNSLLITDKLHALEGGLEVKRVMKSWSDNYDRLIPANSSITVWSPEQWLSVDTSQGQNAIVNWRDSKHRGVYSESYLLGQVRDLEKDETNPNPLQLVDAALRPLHETMRGYEAKLEKLDEGRSKLILSSPNHSTGFHYLIDIDKHVITKQETFTDNKVVATTEYQKFEQIMGRWLPTEIVSTRPEYPTESTYTISLQYRELTQPQFTVAWNKQLSKQEKAFVIAHPLPSVKEALKQSEKDDASLQDRFVLLLHYCSYQNWDDAFEQLRIMEEQADDHPGIRWIRIAIEVSARRNEDARQRIVKFIDDWTEGKLKETPAVNRGDQFLMTHLLSTVYPIIGWAEYAPVLEQVNPFYERQSDSEVALLDWQNRWVQALNALGRTDEKVALQKQMSKQHSGNPTLQIAYGSSLIAINQKQEAENFFKQQIALQDHWKHYELNQLRDRYAEMLESDHEYKALLKFLTTWLEAETETSRVFGRYLSALIFNDQVDQAEQTVRDWLQISQSKDELNPVQLNKLQAATYFALGSGHRLHRNRGMNQEWLPELYRTAKSCLQFDDRRSLAETITSNSSFYNSDLGDRLRSDVLQWLLQDGSHLPVDRLNLYIGILRKGRLLLGEADEMEIRQVTTEEWHQIADLILQRWEAEMKPAVQHQFSQPLITIYSNHLADQYLPFLRRLVQEGDEDYQATYRENLFNVLLTQNWSEEIEQEAFQLWTNLSVLEVDVLNVSHLVPKLYELVDAMLKNRITSDLADWRDQGTQDELTRTEKQEQKEKIVKNAHAELADRIAKTTESVKETHPELLQWLQLERIRLDIALKRNRQQIVKECWNIVGDEFSSKEANAEQTLEDELKEINQSYLRQRALLTLVHLTAQKETSSKQGDRLLNYVDSAIEILSKKTAELRKKQEPDETAIPDLALAWKTMKYKLLILFERKDQLKKQLSLWIESDKSNDHWRHSLAMLLAEEGDLEHAVRIFEQLEEQKRLAEKDYANLANWYLVLDEKQKHEASRIQTLMSQGESALNNRLNQINQQARNGNGPHELNEQTFLILKALLQKTSRPENYYYTIRNLYTSTRDFRTLEAVPDSLLGRTQSQVYNALNQFRHSILNEVRKEATADKMLEFIRQSREKIQAGIVPRGADENTRSLALDLRVLDLLESLIEAKSAQVLNQPGPHVDNAVIALKRAFNHEWQENEHVAYAQFLQHIGALSVSRNREALQPLTNLLLEQFNSLIDQAKPGSVEKVNIVIANTTFLFNSLREQEKGLTLLEATLREFSEQHEGNIPFVNYTFVTTYSSFLQQVKRYAEAENYVVRHLKLLDNDAQRWTYQEHLNRLYEQAFHNNGQVSLGQGPDLFNNLIQNLEAQAETPDRNRRHNLLVQIGNIFNYAIGDKTKGPADEKALLLKFTSESFPRLTTINLDYPTSLVNHFASILNSRISPLEALEFVLIHYENYPTRLSYTSRDPWSQHAWQLAQYRYNAARKNTDPERLKQLEERLLPIILKRIREELVSYSHGNHSIFHDNQTYFWKEKSDEFYKVTHQVIDEHQDSPRTLFAAADYLHEGLSKHQAAIQVMVNSNIRGLLDESGQLKLVTWMHRQKMYESSIPILTKLIDGSSQYMSIRAQLLRAYFETEQEQKLNALLTETHDMFHEDGLWNESHIIELARVCVEIEELETGTGYFEEAINLHQNSHANRGIGGGALSRYYLELANAYGEMGETAEAVDAASAAVVSWGNLYEQRREAVNQLNVIVMVADNFDKFLKQWNQQTEKSGQDSPLIRKAIANRFLKKQQYLQSIEQYKIALEFSAFDREIHQGLMNAFDSMNDGEGAIQQLISQIDTDRHNLKLFTELANRTEKGTALAEKAATSIVESAPNEAESHTALAGFREKQNQWDAAISHWQRAAELRKLEPAGLLGLANAQVHSKKWQAATATIQKLQRTEWPARFNNIESQIRELDRKIPRN